MAGETNRGSTGSATNIRPIDAGTLCRQPSCRPGTVQRNVSAQSLKALKGPILVGQAKRLPGFNFDGTPAEDMQFADSPKKSASIKTDSVFALSDGTLDAYMKQLMTSLSVGKMEKVALAMQKRFYDGVGGTFSSAVLNAEIANHTAFVKYHNAFRRQFQAALKTARFDPTKISTIPMNLLAFTSFWDKVTGLGITVHQVWSAKAELRNFMYESNSGMWVAELTYTFYDHFGLDWEDIVKHGSDHIPQYYTGDFFKAWYILQHYRKAKPFVTEMTRSVVVSSIFS